MLIEEFRSVYYLPSDEIYLIPTVALDDIVKSVKEGININTHAGLEDSQCYSKLVYNIKISYITDAVHNLNLKSKMLLTMMIQKNRR